MSFPHDYSLGNPLHHYNAVIALWRAGREKSIMIAGGNEGHRWPRHCAVWSSPAVGLLPTELDGDTIIFGGVTGWMVPPPGDPGGDLIPRWFGYLDEEAPYIPATYDVVLNCDDVKTERHVQLPITGNDDGSMTVDRQRLDNAVTAGWIPSAEWVLGKPAVIIKRDGLWWGTRWPTRPNDAEKYYGGQSDAVSIVRSTLPAGDYAGLTLSIGPALAPTATAAILESAGDGVTIPWTSTTPSGDVRVLDGATLVASGAITSADDGIRSVEEQLPAGAEGGDDLLVYSGDVLRRLSVTGYTATAVVFDRQAVACSGRWSIVGAGGKGDPINRPDPVFKWYAGATSPYYTHRATDAIYQPELSVTQMPADTITRSVGGGDPLVCEDVTFHNVFDEDHWSDVNEECGEADKCYSPGLYKTLRGVQKAIEEFCPSFVPPISYAGEPPPLPFSFATLLQFIALNFVGAFSASSDEDGALSVNVGLPGGTVVYVEVRDAVSGAGGYIGPATLTEDGAYVDTVPAERSFDVIVSRGWTDPMPRRFAHAYPRSAFIPDVMTSDLGASVAVVPGTHEYPGTWVDRPADAHYLTTDDRGFTVQGNVAFISGSRARYMGDNSADPGIVPHTRVEEGGGVETPYWRHLWEGRFHKLLRPGYELQKAGAIVYGGDGWLFADRDWYAAPMGDGVMGVVSGIATGGSGTTLIDDAQYVEDPETLVVSIDARWAQIDRWKGNVLEVDQQHDNADGDPVTVTYRARIVACPGTEPPTLTIAAVEAYTIPEVPETEETPRVPAVDVPALTIAAGDAYRIREPFRRDWWRGRTLRVTSAEGSTATRLIAGNDDRQLWYEGDAIAFDVAGATFAIEELQVGDVLAWDGAAWVPPADNADGLPLAYLRPARDTFYSRMRKGSCAGHVMSELYRAFNALYKTKTSVEWVGNPQGVTPSPGNAYSAYAFDPSDGSPGSVQHPALVAQVTLAINGGIDPKEGEVVPPVEGTPENGPPYLTILSISNPTTSQVTYSERAAGARVTVSAGMDRAIEVYAYGWIDSLDHDDEDVVEEVTSTGTDGRTYIGVTGHGYHFNPHDLPLVFREYASIATFGASRVVTQSTELFNYPIAAIVPKDPPVLWGEVLIDNDTTFKGTGYGEQREGFAIRDAFAIVDWSPGAEYLAL